MYYIQQLKQICDQLQSTNSTKEKQSILKQNEHNYIFRQVIYFLLNNYITTGISSKKINSDKPKTLQGVNYNAILGATETNTFEHLLDYIKEHNTGRDDDVAMCCCFWINYDLAMQEFIKSIITKSLKLGIDSKSVNKAWGAEFIPTWEVQQAHSIDKYQLKPNEWFSLSEKLNGNRGSYLDGRMTSRQGLEFTGLEHITKDICALGLSDVFVDGEIRRKNVDNLGDNENFSIGTGILNSESGDKLQLEFIIFDVISREEFQKGEGEFTYKDRLEYLKFIGNKIQTLKLENVKMVDFYYDGADKTMIDKYLDIAVAQDKEGLMLNRNTPYRCKRHNGILKVKRFYTMDLPIVAYEEGTGRLQGTLGALVVDFKGNTVNVGSGFDDRTRAELWRCRNELIGRIIEVKYKDTSKDKKTGKESLQFPIFVCLREHGKVVSYD